MEDGTRVDLSIAVRSELERIVQEGPPHLVRRVRIVLARADGVSLTAIASAVHMHRDSVRRWVVRFRERGRAGLEHGNAGKPKNVVFDAAIRAEIRRRASLDPQSLGEGFPTWSLYKLRDHLVRTGVVRSISVESLRLLLRAGGYTREHWMRLGPTVGELFSAETRRALEASVQHADPLQAQRARAMLALAEGGSVREVARTLGVGKNSLRRWLAHFRLLGAAALTLPPRVIRGTALAPNLVEPILHLARSHPRAVGAACDAWSLGQLRAAILRRGMAPGLSLEGLRRLLLAAGIQLPDGPAVAAGPLPPRAAASYAMQAAPDPRGHHLEQGADRDHEPFGWD